VFVLSRLAAEEHAAIKRTLVRILLRNVYLPLKLSKGDFKLDSLKKKSFPKESTERNTYPRDFKYVSEDKKGTNFDLLFRSESAEDAEAGLQILEHLIASRPKSIGDLMDHLPNLLTLYIQPTIVSVIGGKPRGSVGSAGPAAAQGDLRTLNTQWKGRGQALLNQPKLYEGCIVNWTDGYRTILDGSSSTIGPRVQSSSACHLLLETKLKPLFVRQITGLTVVLLLVLITS
jgi:hypothetical protein